MNSIKNPARSRPLSANVKRLMKMARESPQNPDVEKIEREFTARDLAYCDMQGNIFMAAVDQDIPMDYFAPTFMNSQLAGVIDYSFSRAGGMEEDDISNYSANMAVVNALESNAEQKPKHPDPPTEKELQAWVAEYEYAYWLGYIYRCECHMHDESSRMVYGAFNEGFMKEFYGKLSLDEDASTVECAPEICKRLDALLIGKLWKKQKE